MSIQEREAAELRIINYMIAKDTSTVPAPPTISLGGGLYKLATVWSEHTSKSLPANPAGLTQKLKEIGALQTQTQKDADPGNLNFPFTGGRAHLMAHFNAADIVAGHVHNNLNALRAKEKNDWKDMKKHKYPGKSKRHLSARERGESTKAAAAEDEGGDRAIEKEVCSLAFERVVNCDAGEGESSKSSAVAGRIHSVVENSDQSGILARRFVDSLDPRRPAGVRRRGIPSLLCREVEVEELN